MGDEKQSLTGEKGETESESREKEIDCSRGSVWITQFEITRVRKSIKVKTER